MVDISIPNNQNITVSAGSNSSIGANTNADAQLAYSWAAGKGLIQGKDYSAKHYAQQAKQAEQTATDAISHIGTSVEEAAGYAQSAQESAEYIVNNAPEASIEQTSTGAIITTKDLTHGTTTATILNGAKGDKGDTGAQGEQGPQGTQGAQGPQGVSIVSNELYSTSGLYDTYRQTFSDGSHFDYVVKNGEDGGYTLPIASSNTLGGVKIGNNLTIDANGVLSATAGGTVDQTFDGTSTNAQSGVAIAGELNSYVLSSALATVATTGAYSDLTGTPTFTYDSTNERITW